MTDKAPTAADLDHLRGRLDQALAALAGWANLCPVHDTPLDENGVCPECWRLESAAALARIPA